MILSCPACGTRYAVPDSAIGIEGRTVRCAKCRHSWFQEGREYGQDEIPLPDQPAPDQPAHPEPAQPQADLPERDEAQQHQAEPRPTPAATPAFRPLDEDDSFATARSSFEHEPPFRPRRNPARMWSALAISFALITTTAMGLVAYFGLPAWLPLPGQWLGTHSSQPDLKLSFPASRQERIPLTSGNDYFNISGTITNTGATRRSVPPLLIVLRDSRQRAVMTIEADPPKPVLAPGETIAINTAIVDAPKAAVAAHVKWKQP